MMIQVVSNMVKTQSRSKSIGIIISNTVESSIHGTSSD